MAAMLLWRLRHSPDGSTLVCAALTRGPACANGIPTKCVLFLTWVLSTAMDLSCLFLNLSSFFWTLESSFIVWNISLFISAPFTC